MIDQLKTERSDLSEIDLQEEERLADIFGKAFALGVANIPNDLVDELELLGKRLNTDLLGVLQRAPPSLEKLLEDLVGVDVAIELKTPREMAEIRDQIQETSGVAKASEKKE